MSSHDVAPSVSSSAQSQDTGLPPNWEVRLSKSKNLPYYFNTSDTTSRWEPPAGTDTDKLKVYMARYHSTPMPADGSGPGKIRAAHLLVKHEDSRRPKSWKQDPITRSKKDAEKEIKGYLHQIVSGQATLAELATKESDCSSARKRGDLGWFGRGDMQKEFEDAAFALKPGELSGVVESPSGYHLIERLE